MDNVFQRMFSRKPDEICDGDFYYHVSWLGNNNQDQDAIGQKSDKQKFLSNFQNRNSEEEFREGASWRFQRFLQGNEINSKAVAILREIALKEIPFVDLGSYYMGIAPYILHHNPHTPCLITAVDKHHISSLRTYVSEELPDYNINFASFDEIDVPLNDNSIEVVTGVYSISGASQNRPVDSGEMSLNEHAEWCAKKTLDEIYRILKPGGCYIGCEFNSNWYFDWDVLDNYFINHDKIYGLYSKDELYSRLRYHKETEKYMLNDEKIKASGFEIEIKDKHSFKEDPENMPNWFCLEDDTVQIREVLPEEDILELEFRDYLYVLRKPLKSN